MGKLSSVFVFLLMINIVGFILMSAQVELGLAANNPYISENSLLTTFYSPVEDGDGNTQYVVGNGSALYGAIPQEPPESFFDSVGQFIDRIMVMFGFVRVMLGVALFPIALISFMGLPWQLSMLIFPPLMALYMIGFMDLFGGGDN